MCEILVSLATIPGREESLKETLASLLPQVGKVHVYLNGFSEVPVFLVDDQVIAHIGPDIGDVGKFFWCDDATGFCLTVDDDIVYPPNYVEAMVNQVERFGRKACVGVHGAVLTHVPVNDYYADRQVFHFRDSLTRGRPVHILGTGTLCWHASTLELSVADFPSPNMADVWFALNAQRNAVPLVSVPRSHEWLKDTEHSSDSNSIWGTRVTADLQTQAVNVRGAWPLLPMPAISLHITDQNVPDGGLVLLVTACDAAPFVEKCLTSVAAQTVTNWRLILVDDASTDGTANMTGKTANQLGISDRMTLIRHADRRYKTRNVVIAMHELIGDDEIVVMLDGDDWLAHDRVLEKLATEYTEGWDVVWGNWVGSDGMAGTSWHLNSFLPPRRQPWVASAPFSFRARLLKDVPDEEFKDDDGQWFRCACDQAIALPVLERTIRRKHLDEVLYVYNRENPNSHDRQGNRVTPLVSEAPAAASRALYGRDARSPPWDPEFFYNHRFEFVQAALASAERFGGDSARRFVQSELVRLGHTPGRNA